MSKSKIMLDLGCGETKAHGWIGLDRRKIKGVEYQHAIEDVPYPLKDEICSVVKMSHVMEHISPADGKILEVMDEIWRITEVGGFLLLSMPYGTNYRYIQDPTHCNSWNQFTPHYFDPQQPFYHVYKPKPWHIDFLSFDPWGDLEISFKKLPNLIPASNLHFDSHDAGRR